MYAMFITVTPICVIEPLRCAGRRRDEPEERRDHAQREHREDPGFPVVVRAGDHERARHQADRGRRLLVMLHGDAEQLPLCDQHDESGHDGERPLADHQAAQRDAREHDPGEERGRDVALALVRAAPVEIRTHLDRRRLLPAGATEPFGAHDHRPRHAVVLVEVGQDVVFDLAAVDVGEQVVARRSRSRRPRSRRPRPVPRRARRPRGSNPRSARPRPRCLRPTGSRRPSTEPSSPPSPSPRRRERRTGRPDRSGRPTRPRRAVGRRRRPRPRSPPPSARRWARARWCRTRSRRRLRRRSRRPAR